MLKKVTLTATVFSLLLFLTSFTPAIASATDQLGFAVGQHRRIFFGVATLEVTILKVGEEGWLLVEIEENAPGFSMSRGDHYWVNTSQIWMVSE